MLILDKNRKRINKMQLLRWVAVLGGLVLLSIFVIYPAIQSFQDNSSIYCDAEKVKGKKFAKGNYLFDGGDRQSREEAHQGNYSCRLPEAKKAQFGIGYKLKGVRPGEIYKVSVWRKKSKYEVDGFLVLAGPKESNFYKRTKKPVENHPNGWNRLEIVTTIPKNFDESLLNIYVYTNGKGVVYFDDFLIEKLEDVNQLPPDFYPREVAIKLKDKAYRKIVAKRKEAYRVGLLRTDEDSWVKGTLIDDKEELPVSLRLKGDWLDHVQDDKWSFRIKVKDPYAWNRLKVFSFHTPKARYYALEWLLHQMWEREDVLTTRYDFIRFSLNGKSLGSYAYEEHFDKQLLEYRYRREGPIIRLTEEALWDVRTRQIETSGLDNINVPAIAEMVNADIQPFKGNRTQNSPKLKDQFNIAQSLLYDYQQGLKSAGEIFDIPKTARYYAISDVLGAHHGIFWHNQRFYYNPLISRLEPIGFDGYSNRPRKDILPMAKAMVENARGRDISAMKQLFEDEEFMKEYMKCLYKYSSREYLEDFFFEIWPAMQARIDFLKTEFSDVKIDRKRIIQRAQQVYGKLLPYQQHSVRASWHQSEDKEQKLQLSSLHEMPLQVVGFGPSAKRLRDSLSEPIVLAAFRMGHPMIKRYSDAPEATQYVFYKPFGIDTVFSTKVSPWGARDSDRIKADYFKTDVLKCKIPIEKNGKRLRIKKGDYTIDEETLFPAGYELYIDAGTTIDIVNGAKIISRSPVHLLGNSESPIMIKSSDQTAQGFTVLQGAERSSMTYCIFDNLNTLNQSGWTLTGAVTFYESDVDISHCIIQNNHCEDALNLIRSDFFIDELNIKNTPYDGFDADFCTGKLHNSNFTDIGNDGADFSGSQINILNCEFVNCKDKGISVGEESKVIADLIKVKGATIGAASKDLSYLFFKEVDLKECNQGFAAYQKKPEYGPSTIVVKKYWIKDVRYLHTVATRCTLELKSRIIIGE